MGDRDDLDFVTSSMRDGFWRLSAAGTILSANPTLAAWVERTTEEMTGEPADDFIQLASGTLLQEGEMEGTIAGRKIVVRSRPSDEGWIQIVMPERRSAPTPKPVASANADRPLPDQDAFFQLLEEAESIAHRLPFSVLLIQSETSGEADEKFGRQIRTQLRTSDVVARIDEGGYAAILRGTPKAAALEAAQRLSRALVGAGPFQFGISHSVDGIDDIIARAQDSLATP